MTVDDVYTVVNNHQVNFVANRENFHLAFKWCDTNLNNEHWSLSPLKYNTDQEYHQDFDEALLAGVFHFTNLDDLVLFKLNCL